MDAHFLAHKKRGTSSGHDFGMTVPDSKVLAACCNTVFDQLCSQSP